MPASPRMAADHVFDLLDLVAARQHAVGQVRPVEIADQHERLAQPQLRADVARAPARVAVAV